MKKVLFVVAGIIVLLIGIMVFKNQTINRYDINSSIGNYNLHSYEKKNEYMNFLEEKIYPVEIRKFIDNDFVPMSLLGKEDTGKDMMELMEFIGYKMLFMSMFDKERTNFDDCPVTNNFKEKFTENLLKYFNLIESDDCESNCLLNREDKEITVEVYGNFKNTEPTYWITHHFHYTLDDEGNVDDVIFDYTEE